MGFHAIKHFKTITHHKILVAKGCFRVGLYRQGLLHDMSKYSPSEFLVGCKYYQGFRSPNDAERRVKGYSSSWLHHKGRNKHHFEYWTDYNLARKCVMPIKMPLKYVIEMFCDRVAASKTYMKDKYTDAYPLEYFERGKSTRSIDPETSALLEKLLIMLRDEGEKKTFRYIRKELKKHKDY